jgi:hypothetical protein
MQQPMHAGMAVPHAKLALGQGTDVENAIGNDTVAFEIGSGEHFLFEDLLLFWGQSGRRAAAVAIDQSLDPALVITAHPDPQHVARHAELPGGRLPLASFQQPRDRQNAAAHLAAILRPRRLAQHFRAEPL